MVEEQLIRRGISNPGVLQAMGNVPREEFIPESFRHKAYEDMALPIGGGQTISQPYMVALMTELLSLSGTEKILEVGTGSGYQAAVLSLLAREIYTIEFYPAISGRAEKILSTLGCRNVHCRNGDGTMGIPEEAPFDGIIVTAGAPDVPRPLLGQMKEGTILVIPVGDRHSQVLIKGVKEKGQLRKEETISCVFVPLIGKYGWEPN